MVEMAALDNYKGSDPDLVVMEVCTSPQFIGGGNQFIFYTSGANAIWRPRFVNIFGDVQGGPNNLAVSFNALIPGSIANPWTAAGPLCCASPVTYQPNEELMITWSTEIGDNYFHADTPFGNSANLGMPLVYLPARTEFAIAVNPVGGALQDFVLQDGMMQIEKFPPSVLQGGGQGQGGNVYLLPQTI